jgi:hypothetical protein
MNFFEDGAKPLQDELNNRVGLIQENIKTKKVTPYGPMNLTGEAANSLLTRVNFPDEYSIQGQIVSVGKAAKYIDTLETGRKAGPVPFAPIYLWVIRRKLFPEKGTQKDLAYAITNKIRTEGTLLHRLGGNSGNLGEARKKEDIELIKAKMVNFALTKLKQVIIKSVNNG